MSIINKNNPALSQRTMQARETIEKRLRELKEGVARVKLSNDEEQNERAKVNAKDCALICDLRRFQELNEASEERVRLAKMKLCEEVEWKERSALVIKEQCFDSMKTRRRAVTSYSAEQRDEIFRDPVAVMNFGIPKKEDLVWEANGGKKIFFLSEVAFRLSRVDANDFVEKKSIGKDVVVDDEDEERALDSLLYNLSFQLQCDNPERMKMQHALLLRSARVKKEKFNKLFDDVVFEKQRVVDRAKTGWKKAKSIARGVLKETPEKQLGCIRVDSFFKTKSGEHMNAWDIVTRLNVLANSRPMHWLEDEDRIFKVDESEMENKRVLLENFDEQQQEHDTKGEEDVYNNNNNNSNINNEDDDEEQSNKSKAESMKKALKTMFLKNNNTENDGGDSDEDYFATRDNDDDDDDDDVSDPSDDDEDENNNNLLIDSGDEAPFEKNLRLRAKAERFQKKKEKKIRAAKKLAFQRLLDIHDEAVKNRVRINQRVYDLEATKNKVHVEILSLELRAARVFERLKQIEKFDDASETMTRPDETLERLINEAREANVAFQNHDPILANAKTKLEATTEQLKIYERQFRRETRDAPAAAIHADTLLVLYRQDGPVLRKNKIGAAAGVSTSSSSSSTAMTSSLDAERKKIRRESIFSPASMMQQQQQQQHPHGGARNKSIFSGGEEFNNIENMNDAHSTENHQQQRQNRLATYFPLSLDEAWFEKLNLHRSQRQALERLKLQQKLIRESCEKTLKVLEQKMVEATKAVSERKLYLKDEFTKRFNRMNDCDVTMKLPYGLVETILLDNEEEKDEQENEKGQSGDILYVPRNIVDELNTQAKTRREMLINLLIANKKLTGNIERSKWYIEYAKRRNCEHVERARELALLRSSKSLQLFMKAGNNSSTNNNANNNNANDASSSLMRNNNNCDNEDEEDEKEIGDAANAKARFRHNDALHEKERKNYQNRMEELFRKKKKLLKTISTLKEEEEKEQEDSNNNNSSNSESVSINNRIDIIGPATANNNNNNSNSNKAILIK